MFHSYYYYYYHQHHHHYYCYHYTTTITTTSTTINTTTTTNTMPIRTYLQIHTASYPDIWTLYQHRRENLNSPTHIQVAEAGLERVPH